MLAGQRGDRTRPLMNSSNLTSHNEKVDIPEGAVVAARSSPSLSFNLEEIQSTECLWIKEMLSLKHVVSRSCVVEENVFLRQPPSNRICAASKLGGTWEAEAGVFS